MCSLVMSFFSRNFIKAEITVVDYLHVYSTVFTQSHFTALKIGQNLHASMENFRRACHILSNEIL